MYLWSLVSETSTWRFNKFHSWSKLQILIRYFTIIEPFYVHDNIFLHTYSYQEPCKIKIYLLSHFNEVHKSWISTITTRKKSMRLPVSSTNSFLFNLLETRFFDYNYIMITFQLKTFYRSFYFGWKCIRFTIVIPYLFLKLTAYTLLQIFDDNLDICTGVCHYSTSLQCTLGTCNYLWKNLYKEQKVTVTILYYQSPLCMYSTMTRSKYNQCSH